jgi:TonB family protein
MPAIFRSSFFLFFFLLASVALAQEPAPAGPPYRVGENVTRPEKTSGSPPEYTDEAREAKVQGVVILETVIDEKGNVTDVRVLKGLPSGLDEAALEAVRTWKFNPAKMDGKPVPVYYTLTVNFTMEEGPKALHAQDVFWDFALKHPELEALMRAGKRPEALAHLEGMADTPEVHFARSFLLTGLRRYPEAMKEAEGVNEGPERELLNQLFVLYSLMESRAKTIDADLQTAAEALEANPDSKEAMLKKIRLLREKARLMDGGPERDAVLEEAGRLEKQAGKSQ